MLSRRSIYAIKALLELALEPERWRSTHALASAQHLPEPMLEQILLRLRRGGLLVARRGRLGGYRLAVPTKDVHLLAVLVSLGEHAKDNSAELPPESSTDQVTEALSRQLEAARKRVLSELNLEELLYDLQSSEARIDWDTGVLLG